MESHQEGLKEHSSRILPAVHKNVAERDENVLDAKMIALKEAPCCSLFQIEIYFVIPVPLHFLHTYYIYIYIYIVIHRQTCFVLSELISVIRQ